MSSKENPAQRPAVEIGETCSLSEPARRLLHSGQSVSAFQALLKQHRLHDDAVRFGACLLPKREAVWWGCLCAWQVYRPKPPDKESKALQATVRWVDDPSEEKRRALDAEKDSAGMETPAGALAAAAFLSGGSLTPTGMPTVAPDPSLTAKLVGSTVLLVSTRIPGDQCEEILSHFLDLANDIAEGKLSWSQDIT